MIPEGKGWIYSATKKGVEIYTKTTPFSPKYPDITVQHVGFSKGKHWYNYCFPADMYWYLDEFLDFFLADCEIKDKWQEMLRKVHENELGVKENKTRLV